MRHLGIHRRVPLSSGAPVACMGRVSPTEATPEWDAGAEDLNHGRSRTQPKDTRAVKPPDTSHSGKKGETEGREEKGEGGRERG